MRQKRRERGEAERAAEAAAAEAAGAEAVIETEAETDVEADAEDLAEAAAEALADAPGEHDAAGESEPEAAPDSEADVEADGDAEVEADGEPVVVVELDAAKLKSLVEAIVFASDKPVTVVRLKQLTRIKDAARIQAALDELAGDYKDRGIALQSISGGYMFRTQSHFSGWVQQLVAGRPVRLSRAQLETLAIIAYRQPITRPEIDDIRGVDSGGTLKVLLDRQLIRILGKKEEAGRPLLYGTTKEFLDFFSLGDLRELPTLREYSELSEEHRKVVDEEHGEEPESEPAEAIGDTVHVHQHEVPAEAVAEAAPESIDESADAPPAPVEDESAA
jgi:segregation and condensation protein B